MRALQISVRLAEEAAQLSEVVLQASRIRSRAGLQDWLLGPMRQWLPHDAVVVAWGDFHGGEICHDVIGASPQELHASPADLGRRCRDAFMRWRQSGEQPIVLRGAQAWSEREDARILAHGLTNKLGRYDCMYLFVGAPEVDTARSRDIVRILLPSIDTAFRQAVDTRPATAIRHDEAFDQDSFFDELADDTAPAPGSSLSEREFEVMRWVRMGKTNSEIAMILNLSTFTVKNHMRRIYRKLKAGNRAQAVSLVGSQEAFQ